MNNLTDNAFVPTMDAQVTEHFEDTDTLADADGVEARHGGGAHAKDKEQTPEFVLAEFKRFRQLHTVRRFRVLFATVFIRRATHLELPGRDQYKFRLR